MAVDVFLALLIFIGIYYHWMFGWTNERLSAAQANILRNFIMSLAVHSLTCCNGFVSPFVEEESM